MYTRADYASNKRANRQLKWLFSSRRQQQERRRLPKYHRDKIELVRACDEERWRTHTEESVEGGYTREKEERTTENKMERRVSTRLEKYWTESGRGDGQGDVEKKDHQSYRRPYMMGNARGKEEEEV